MPQRLNKRSICVQAGLPSHSSRRVIIRNGIFGRESSMCGAPPHWGLCVRDFLNEVFPNRWIGRDGPTPWPARSPDITPLDFFLWGYVKDNVYRTPICDLQTLKTRIKEAIASVTFEMLQNTWREIDHRLDVLRATNGAHVEVR